MSDSITKAKRPRGRPKKSALSPSRRDRLIAEGKYEEYKKKHGEAFIKRRRAKETAAKVEAGIIPKELGERLCSDDREVYLAAKQDEPYEQTKISVKHAVKIELARRELARRKLIHYTQRNLPHYQAGWVHIEIAEKLEKFREDVIAGLSPRLAIFMPPRLGKTELIKQFISQTLGLYPYLEFICCSYSAQLQESISGQIQDTVRSSEWKVLFPNAVLDKRREAVSDWKLAKHGGGVLAVGVGGSITGRGANILVIDDPVKNREEADSETTRASTWNWYTSTAYTRLMPGAGVLVIQTRWHDDDLSGRILAQQAEAAKVERDTGKWPDDVDRWTVIEYPAIALEDEAHRNAGEALHPQRFPLHALQKIRRTIGPRDWAALYQQNPVADEGAYFKKETLKYYDSLPELLNYYTAADLAISKKETADYSVIVTVGIDPRDNMYVVDLQRGRWDAMEIVDRLVSVYKAYKPKTLGIEAGQIEKAIGPFLNKRIYEERLYSMYVEPLPPGRRDKELRARPLQGRMGQGKVLLPRNQIWLEPLIHELLRFPSGVHDDQVDALAWIGQMLDTLSAASVPAPPIKKSWKDDLSKYITNSDGSYDPMAA